MQRNIQLIVVAAVLLITIIITNGCASISKGSYGGAVGSIDKPSCQKAI